MSELRKFVETITPIAKSNVKKFGDHVPMVFAKIGGDVVSVAVVGGRNEMKACINQFKMAGAEWIVVVNTMWYKTVDSLEEVEKWHGDLEKDPGRREILAVMGFSPSEQHFRFFEIVRNGEIELKELKFGDNVFIAGYLAPW